MITHLFQEGNPRQDYLFKIVSSYLGLSIQPCSKKKESVIIFESLNGTRSGRYHTKAVIRIDEVPKKGFKFKPVISDYFSWKGFKVPVFHRSDSTREGKIFLKDSGGNPLISLSSENSNQITATIDFDILNTIYYFLCGIEEIESTRSDEFGRFQHSSSVLYKKKLMHTPLATIYLDIILELVKEIYKISETPLIRIWPWPHNKEFGLGLSHDTDEIQRFTIKKSAHSMLKHDISTSYRSLKESFGPLTENDYWTFSRIMDIEKKLGTRSTFFFSGLTNKIKSKRPRKERQLYELAYTTDPPEIKELYRSIDTNGWEIGLHSSFSTKNDPRRLREEMKNLSGIIDKQIGGIRQHFLKFKIPDYFKAIQEVGFKYDASLGYSTHSGFRTAACHPYTFFNDSEKKEYDLLVIPLAIMEGTLSSKKRVDPDAIKDNAMGIISTIRKLKGGCSILWHNNRFFDKEFKGWGKAYELIVKASKTKRGYVSSLEDVYHWVDSKDKVNITLKKGSLSIRSPVTLEGLTIEINANEDFISRFDPRIEGIEVKRSKRDCMRMIIDKIKSNKGVSIPFD
jgi:peptidoglycan/xylan/chitin deacetylase (PgdA/CDA1 family)